MPLYEYKCQSCETITEFLMKMSDPNPTECPACSKDSLVKIMSRTNFVLKGSGWYETDFKDKPANNSGGKNSEDSKSDSKTNSATSSQDADSSSSTSSTESEASTNKKVETKTADKSISKSDSGSGSSSTGKSPSPS